MATFENSITGPLLSVVIPVYNECRTIERIVAAVGSVAIDKEIIIVDDGSNDGTLEKAAQIGDLNGRVRVLSHDHNQGKGAALRTGFAAAHGQFVVVQDADLEYDPADLCKLIQPLIDDRADVVFGTRFSGGFPRAGFSSWHMMGNRFLTLLSNLFTNMNVTDMETCYKAFRREIIQDIETRENRFGVEPEITAKLAHYRWRGRPLRILEVGISYCRRSYQEGKKISWRDGVSAIRCILRYNLFR